MVQGTAPRAALCWQGRLKVDLPRQLQGQHGQSALGKSTSGTQLSPSQCPQLRHHFLRSLS